MANIQFKVFSELYGETDAVICDLNEAIRIGYCPCGDGCDYVFTEHELRQLKSGYSEHEFIPSSTLAEPLNWVALMRIDGNKLLLPKTFRFNKQQYASVKNVLSIAGGIYNKNTFVFKEDAMVVYDRIINGENFNLKKKFQFFGTPDNLADRLVQLADIKDSDRILEPSAGQGSIIKAINRVLPKMMIECLELMPQNKSELESIDTAVIIGDDFLKHTETILFDKIIANPPFSKNQDIDHILHMYKLLNEGGRIVSIASKHWQKSENKKEKSFKEFLSQNNATFHELAGGEFKESGTSIASVIIVIDKK